MHPGCTLGFVFWFRSVSLLFGANILVASQSWKTLWHHLTQWISSCVSGSPGPWTGVLEPARVKAGPPSLHAELVLV